MESFWETAAAARCSGAAGLVFSESASANVEFSAAATTTSADSAAETAGEAAPLVYETCIQR